MGCGLYALFFTLWGDVMRTIERLLARAKAVKGSDVRDIIAFVEYRPDKRLYTAAGTLWDGRTKAEGDSFYSEHETPQEALAASEAIANKYPNAETVRIFIDDMTFPEGVTLNAED